MPKRRAVITGIGPITCIGTGREDFWRGLRAEKSGIQRISSFDTAEFNAHCGGEIPEWTPEDYFPASVHVLDKSAQLVGVADDVDGANAAVDDVERVGAGAGDRMTQQETGCAVDRDEPEVRLRVVDLPGIAEHELRDALGAEQGPRRRGRLAAAINGWNRLNIAARTAPGDYVPGSLAKLHAAK